MEEGARAGTATAAGLSDAVLLAPLTEDTFLHNLHLRYKKDIIYTYVGNAVVSVNPCRPLPLYSPELARSYLARPPFQLPPHLYAITATAYRWVRDRNESQCIVITGESGSGKTEAARVCLQGALLAGAGAGASAGAGARLTAAGTLLEAFGNAATARNHNASRFGKLLDIEFDFKGDPVGGHITHYLLEKGRASGAAEGERNFHVLYQLLAGADVPLLKRLRLQRAVSRYRILRAPCPAPATRPAPSPRRAPPAPAARAAAADTQHFAFTKAAMVTLGFEPEQCEEILHVLAFLLKIGNVEFEPQHNIDGTIGTRLHHDHELREACALVGAESERLCAALGCGEGEPQGAEAAADGAGAEGAERACALRDRLVAALYARLFTWLVNAVNAAIQGECNRSGERCTLGVLDVYGLESLAHNGLERLLINYAAERVQASVAAATLRREQEQYLREGLPWSPLPGADSDLHPDLLDLGPDSVLAALSDCSAHGTSDAAFLQRLQRRRHSRLIVAADRFQVVHFGGPVWYNASGIVAQNRDATCRRCAAVLGGARSPLLRALFAEGAGEGSPRRPAALACRQRALVSALARRLAAGPPPRLVRCLRADVALRPQRFDAPLLRHQLRTQGIVEMALLRRAGWCEALCARGVLSRYSLLAPRPAPPALVPPPPEDPVRAARSLLRSLPIPSAEFAYGRTKVFIRSPRTVWELEALRGARVKRLVVSLQRAWRRHLAARCRAQRVIARAWRAYQATKVLPERVSLRSKLEARRRVSGLGAAERGGWAARVVWRAWAAWARREYLSGLWARLPGRLASPAARGWPPCPRPALLARTDALLRRLHHRWRCLLYRRAFDQTARNRMREKVTASVLFKERKANYSCSVAHPFIGDYVRLRASGAWRRGAGARAPDRYVVFADVVGKVARASGRVARCLAVVSTGALLLLEPRSLRLKRRVPAPAVYRLSLSPYADDLLVVHVACGAAGVGGGEGPATCAPGADSSAEELSQCSSRDAPDAAGCLFAGEGAWRRRGDVVVRTCHVLELATKLFLVVQNAVGAPPHVNIATEFEANFGGQVVTIAFHALGGGAGGPARVARRGSRMDVLL